MKAFNNIEATQTTFKRTYRCKKTAPLHFIPCSTNFKDQEAKIDKYFESQIEDSMVLNRAQKKVSFLGNQMHGKVYKKGEEEMPSKPKKINF